MNDRLQYRKGDLCSKTFTLKAADDGAAMTGVNLSTATLITLRVYDSNNALFATFSNTVSPGGITVVTTASGICSLRASELLTAAVAEYTAEIDVTFVNGDRLGWPLRSGGFAISVVGLAE